MRIESVEFFYAAMPSITLEADGSQDALLVRVVADGVVGWGECEASPLVSLAAFVTPRSHGVCQPVSASVLGERLDSPADIARISALVARNSMDLLQAPHTYSGIEMALWDLLGHAREEPVWRLLGYDASYPKVAYASLLFGDTPDETLSRARSATERGFRAVKFGWGPFGEGTPEADADQLQAAREGVGRDTTLLVDAGQIWGEDVESAALRIPALEDARVTWLEEPFPAHAYAEHAALAARTRTLRIAGGEGAHNLHMARNLVDYGHIGFLQIDTGRIGGIGPAKAAADYAAGKGVTFVNHTFTSHLALSASLQPFAGLADHRISEYPAAPKALALDITRDHLLPDADGRIAAPEGPGLGVSVDLDRLGGYVRDVEILLDGDQLYRSPQVGGVAASSALHGIGRA
ncbi:Mandelate racemase/muconate lactonizing protein [Beutenbergia cavernae DSM 12333]|uniref:Mandelate racemase/muconate lactonizing protein n=1 Tax=Beutenbergia cavernae (strain ATCC BAA-8 / DSM 12333 / CCUG 43141 / JCM 11478 / NBRC 16432 / NCIMB 13614 / HKI 0122) TaxID=471853 RepID=C5BV15_BEUC1|nr:mandelate racemase/muconate lactonizing enzyme family protein [Beutenbergia cavernae]ACQ78389.1 Mandelate racemase/muconate lactonizing protein [Beutenbergia cavernae DSM 12333]